MKTIVIIISVFVYFGVQANAQPDAALPAQAKTTNGIIEGINESGIRIFKGIPYAAPPVGDLRWKPPQPVKSWKGIRKADQFSPRAMQKPVFADMVFRSNGVSEDCLYLNIWTPANASGEQLPVLVYFYGGGFIGGDGSEYRYDGESMARKGIVAVTVNYRLGVFGFLAHPELTAESPHHASGNYGLMDQAQALHWIQQNIASFGGDPKKITIAGESAGSFSVSAQMASPLSKNLIAGAIGESGSLLGKQSTISLGDAEKKGFEFAQSIGANSLTALRAMPADQLLEAASKPGTRFQVTVDGYFFPKPPVQIYAAGEQAHVPLLVGWNSAEMSYQSLIGPDKPTIERYSNAVQKLYGDKSADVMKYYGAASEDHVIQAATDLASDRFIGFTTWKWSDIQSMTGKKPVYRYMFSRPRPGLRSEINKIITASGSSDSSAIKMPAVMGAVHSAEIEYALGNLSTNRVYDWQPEDYKVSEIMQAFFVNFIKTGNPNGQGLPGWPAFKSGAAPARVMYIDVQTKAGMEKNRERYLFFDRHL